MALVRTSLDARRTGAVVSNATTSARMSAENLVTDDEFRDWKWDAEPETLWQAIDVPLLRNCL